MLGHQPMHNRVGYHLAPACAVSLIALPLGNK